MRTTHVLFAVAVLCSLLAVTASAQAPAQPQEISMKSGESADLGPVYWIRSSDCQSRLKPFLTSIFWKARQVFR